MECMSPFRSVRATLACCWLALATPGLLFGQGNYAPQGGEYNIAGPLPGDQVHSQLSLKTSGGFLVWEDNFTDGDGLGISALRLDSSFSPVLSSFRVNQIGAGDQERPRVSVLNGGGAAFVWQGGRQGFQNIYARFLSASNTWITSDVLVNSFTNRSKLNPALATLANSNVVVIWASYNQVSTNSLQDVYGQVLTPAGQKVGGEFLVNQFTAYNQRTPAIAALVGGGFVVAWVSEQQRFTDAQNTQPSVDVYLRLFDANASPVSSEILANTTTNICANPTVCPNVSQAGVWRVNAATGDKQQIAAPPTDGGHGWDDIAPLSGPGVP